MNVKKKENVFITIGNNLKRLFEEDDIDTLKQKTELEKTKAKYLNAKLETDKINNKLDKLKNKDGGEIFGF